MNTTTLKSKRFIFIRNRSVLIGPIIMCITLCFIVLYCIILYINFVSRMLPRTNKKMVRMFLYTIENC